MSNSTGKVLLIEENPDDLRLMSVVLGQALETVELVPIPDAVSFAEYLHRGEIGAVVCCCRLSWGDPVRVLQAVRRSCPQAVLLISHQPGERHQIPQLETLAPRAWITKTSAGFLSLADELGDHRATVIRSQESQELELLRSLVAENAHGLIHINQRGEIVYCDSAIAEWLGYSPAEALIGQGIADWAEDSDRAQELLRQLPELQGEVSLSLGLRRGCGDHLPAQVRICSLTPSAVQNAGQESERRFLLLVQQNAGHVDESASQRHKNDPKLQDLMQFIRDDLEDPLQLIERYAQLLQERHGSQLDENVQRYLKHLTHGCGSMRAMVEGLLEYSYVESANFSLQPVDLNLVVAGAIEELQQQADDNRIRLTIGKLPTVTGEKRQLQSLFHHLISNAIKFHHPDRLPVEVDIRASSGENGKVISIEDNGIGIDEHDQRIIFDLYQCLSKGQDYPGSGVGLALSQRIAERHGGRIDVSSRSGHGSRFDVFFPDRVQQPFSTTSMERAVGG